MSSELCLRRITISLLKEPTLPDVCLPRDPISRWAELSTQSRTVTAVDFDHDGVSSARVGDIQEEGWRPSDVEG